MSKQEKSIRITGEEQRRYAREVIGRIVVGGSRVWEVVIRPHVESRSMKQNDKFHPLIRDIQRQAVVPGPLGDPITLANMTFDQVKAALVDAFTAACESGGEPLTHPGRQTWNWLQRRFVYVRPETKQFNKAECSDFIEFLYSTGIDHDVQFSDQSQAVYAELQEAA